MPSPRAPVIALTHGGGPLPVLGHASQAAIARSLRTKVPRILNLAVNNDGDGDGDGATGSARGASGGAAPPPPKAILLVTAHWATDVATVSTGRKPGLLYDYDGFPPEAYRLQYDAPGSPEVAATVMAALREAGFEAEGDGERGWDHGVFVPLLLIHPDPTSPRIPIVQLSLPRPSSSSAPARLYSLGRALLPLRSPPHDVAILGSGSASFHNLRRLFAPGLTSSPAFRALHGAWQRRLDDAVRTRDGQERARKLAGWREWEGSAEMHPPGAEEHFGPLLVCAGAAGTLEDGSGEEVWGWEDEMAGLAMGTWAWGVRRGQGA